MLLFHLNNFYLNLRFALILVFLVHSFISLLSNRINSALVTNFSLNNYPIRMPFMTLINYVFHFNFAILLLTLKYNPITIR